MRGKLQTLQLYKMQNTCFSQQQQQKKNRQDFTDIVIHLYVSSELLVVLPFLSFFRSQLPKLPGKKIPVLQTITIRRVIINQIASSSAFYRFLPS